MKDKMLKARSRKPKTSGSGEMSSAIVMAEATKAALGPSKDPRKMMMKRMGPEEEMHSPEDQRTVLSDKDELDFQEWYSSLREELLDLDIELSGDPDREDRKFDLRGMFLRGEEPDPQTFRASRGKKR